MSDFEAIHIHPTAALAERVLLPGDPGRALALAQFLLQEPRMFNHNRGLWGYTGRANLDGEPLTIQSTGMGGPSAAIVLEELIGLGARRAIRVGTCGALNPDLRLGELLIARETIARDGTSRALGARDRVPADVGITESLQAIATGSQAGTIVTTDLFYEPPTEIEPRGDWLREGALAIEMEAAALFCVGERMKVPIGCILIVSDLLSGTRGRERIAVEPLLEAAERMGSAAVAALSG